MLDVDLSVTSLELVGVLTRNSESLKAQLSRSSALTCTISKDASIINYQGDYEFTPSQVEQVIQTKNRFVSRDFVINPIPSNYGLITWDGSILTVS